MAESVVSFVVEKLGDLIINQATLLVGAREQIKQLHIELELMQGFLEDADKRQNENKSVQILVSKIRDAAYDAQDIIETFALDVLSRKRENVFKRYSAFLSKPIKLYKVGSEIEAIKARISDLSRSLQTYGVNAAREEGSTSATLHRQLRWSYAHILEEYTVGLDENRNHVVSQLVSEKNHSRSVSICAMGGLGKTTLAKSVYRHSAVRGHFEGFAWAYVSQDCKRRDVWEGILLSISSPSKDERDRIMEMTEKELPARNRILKMTEAELAEELNQVLQEKRCLVILDDIWDTQAWDILSPAFPKGMGSSKILLTTRNRDVALHVDPNGFLYEPLCLNKEDGWNLFQHKAFSRRRPGLFSSSSFFK